MVWWTNKQLAAVFNTCFLKHTANINGNKLKEEMPVSLSNYSAKSSVCFRWTGNLNPASAMLVDIVTDSIMETRTWIQRLFKRRSFRVTTALKTFIWTDCKKKPQNETTNSPSSTKAKPLKDKEYSIMVIFQTWLCCVYIAFWEDLSKISMG